MTLYAKRALIARKMDRLVSGQEFELLDQWGVAEAILNNLIQNGCPWNVVAIRSRIRWVLYPRLSEGAPKRVIDRVLGSKLENLRYWPGF